MTATSIEMRDTVAASDPGDVRTAFEFTRGTLINRYVVLKRLGAGGMSIVYAAYDPELRRRVALKLLLFDAEGADQVRMLREARAIARLSHPNVITVFDVGTFEGRIYITMEYVDGQTMRDWWASAPRGWSETLAVFLDAARGLSAAHAAGLIHRGASPPPVTPRQTLAHRRSQRIPRGYRGGLAPRCPASPRVAPLRGKTVATDRPGPSPVPSPVPSPRSRPSGRCPGRGRRPVAAPGPARRVRHACRRSPATRAAKRPVAITDHDFASGKSFQNKVNGLFAVGYPPRVDAHLCTVHCVVSFFKLRKRRSQVCRHHASRVEVSKRY